MYFSHIHVCTQGNSIIKVYEFYLVFNSAGVSTTGFGACRLQRLRADMRRGKFGFKGCGLLGFRFAEKALRVVPWFHCP